jgi:hypothetical protein
VRGDYSTSVRIIFAKGTFRRDDSAGRKYLVVDWIIVVDVNDKEIDTMWEDAGLR